MEREPFAEGLRPDADFWRLEAEPSRFLSESYDKNKQFRNYISFLPRDKISF